MYQIKVASYDQLQTPKSLDQFEIVVGENKFTEKYFVVVADIVDLMTENLIRFPLYRIMYHTIFE